MFVVIVHQCSLFSCDQISVGSILNDIVEQQSNIMTIISSEKNLSWLKRECITGIFFPPNQALPLVVFGMCLNQPDEFVVRIVF